MQQIVVLSVLALVWAAVLIPQHLRNRADARPADSVGAFREQLSVLGRTSPAGSHRDRPRASHPIAGEAAAARLRGRTQARKRRKTVLSGLLAATGASLVLGFVPGLGVLHGLALLLVTLSGAYLVLLVRRREAAAEREHKVRYLPTGAPEPDPEPVVLLRRASS